MKTGGYVAKSRGLRRLATGFMILALAAPAPIMAQADALARVERLVGDGRFADARTSFDKRISAANAVGETTVLAAPSAGLAPAETETGTDGAVGPFTIQLGAFSTVSRSAALVTEASAADLDVRVVRIEGSELVRVRLGAFNARDEAEERAREIRDLGFEAVVSSDRAGEVRIR